MKLSAWARQQGLTYQTAWRMWKEGKLPVPAEQLPTGTIIVHSEKASADAGVALYARVSSADPKADLDRQMAREGDRHGNFVGTERIDLPLRGKSKHQALALIANAAATVAKQAKAAGKPVAIERLDLKKRKAELESVTPDQARTISAFAYTKIIHHLKSACFRAGVEVIEVNPAYTSVIGAVRFAKPYGISIHQGAALAIARRGLGFSERLPRRTVVVPVRNCGHVALTLPVRNRERHVWSQWAEVGRRLKAAHAAHVRLRHRLTPLPPETPAMSAHRGSTVKLRGANRFQRCSGSVVGDVLQ